MGWSYITSGELTNAFRISPEYLNGRDYFAYLSVEGRVLLKVILRK
jgi:hypothetical protein